ncbi:hypothetical protein HanLR1_Chr11g0386521 [Helianthus annuus]|nr:hypothetical protein HanLR1_Chr11g0386521 [Helianthus annuus]
MAVSHSPNSKSKKKAADTNPQPHKRNSNPVVRLIHGRIYDSHNGSTCHQVCLLISLLLFTFCVQL